MANGYLEVPERLARSHPQDLTKFAHEVVTELTYEFAGIGPSFTEGLHIEARPLTGLKLSRRFPWVRMQRVIRVSIRHPQDTPAANVHDMTQQARRIVERFSRAWGLHDAYTQTLVAPINDSEKEQGGEEKK